MCNAACQAKLKLNGARVTGEIIGLNQLMERLEKEGVDLEKLISEAKGYKVIGALDVAEDLLKELNDLLLASTGYKRRTPKATL